METNNKQIPTGKKIYFASDFHLGVPNDSISLLREKSIVDWLNFIQADAFEIYLVGDIFDFWFEYKTVIPRGYTRLLGKIAELTDKGIKINYFTGNHDMWTFGYLEKETGVTLYRNPIEITYNNKTFMIGHGDGLGPGDNGYKMIKKIFASPICQWLFARLHPNFSIGLANFWSRKSRSVNQPKDKIFLGDDKEWLVIYCKEVLQTKSINYFIFGHRHLLLNIPLNETSTYINLGDWFKAKNYAVFDGETLKLLQF